MKKKITALLLVCTMAVPYGTMPVYAGALNETEAGVPETYEADSAETYAPEETEVYEVESGETEYVLEPEVSDDYTVQASGERTGGNINWNYPDNIIPTDKTTASDGCLLAGVKGTYLADAQNALDLINQYRKEACDNGYPDPRDSSRKLTSSDYKPIKWSSDLEYIARIRAAEASVLISHTRPNGQICFSLSSPNSIGSYGEVLAWNGSDAMLDGIKQWYGEKQYWLDQNSSEETGHYTQMIDPDNSYVGIAAFLNEKGVYYNTTSGEFTTAENLDEETAPKVEDCIQTIEVKKEETSGSIEGLDTNAKVGDTEQAKFKLTYNDCDLQYLPDVTGAAIKWSSDNEDIAKVDQNGTVTAVGVGQVTITAEADCGLKASCKITVSENTEKITESDVTVGECTYTGSEIKPSVTVKHNGKALKEGTDYTCTYTKGVQAGDTITVTVEGKGDYSGIVTKTVTIQAKSLEGNTEITVGKCDFTDIDSVSDAIVVRCDGKTLTRDEDYYISSLSLSSNGYVAEINVSVEGLGNYCGTVQNELTVTKDQKLSIYSVSVKCASDGLNVAWQSSGKADGFYVYRSIYQNGKWGSWKRIKDVTNGSTLKWKDKNVDSSTLYRYTVRSYNASGKSDYTDKNVVQTYFVSKPTVKLTNGSKGVNVSWSKSKNASGYYIYRKEKKSDSWKKVKTVDSKTTKWTDTDAKAGKQYYYTVVAYRSKSRSAFETDKALYRLAQPDFTLSNTSKGVAVKTKVNKSLDGYRIYKKDSDGKWQRVATVKADKAVTWTDTSVKKNKKYTYTVRAYKKNDASSYHSGKSITYKTSK